MSNQKYLFSSLVLFTFLISAVFSGCSDSPSTTGDTPPTDTTVIANPGTIFRLSQIDTAYKGWVDDAPIKLSLKNSAGVVSGSISYEKTGKTSPLTGTIDFMGRFNFRVRGKDGDNLVTGIFLDNHSLRGFWDHAMGQDPFEFIASSLPADATVVKPGETHLHTILCDNSNCTYVLQTPAMPLARQTITTFLPMAVCPTDTNCAESYWNSYFMLNDSLILSGWTGRDVGGKIAETIHWTFLTSPKPMAVFLSDFLKSPAAFVALLEKKKTGKSLILMNEFDFGLDNSRLIITAVNENGIRTLVEFGHNELKDMVNAEHPVGAYILKHAISQ